MIGVVLAHIFDSEVVNAERKHDVFGGVFPKRGGAHDRGISKLVEIQLKAVIHNAPGLFQAWNSFAGFHINPAVGGQGANIVLADDFVGDNVQGNLHIFVSGHWSVIIIINYFQGQEPGIGGGSNTIQKMLGCREAGAVCGSNYWKIQFVIANRDAGSMGFRFVWANAGD